MRKNDIINISVVLFSVVFVLITICIARMPHKKITNTSVKIELQQPDDKIHGTFYIDINDITPNIFEGIFVSPPKPMIKKINLKINNEMDIVFKFVKSKNNRISKIVANVIGYQVITQCEKENTLPELVIGIMKVESFFNPSAVSKKGARGLMQVLDKKCDGEKIDHKRLHDIDYNIEKGIQIFKSKLRIAKGNVSKALFYYVGGDIKNPMKSTIAHQYVDDVFKVMGEFRYFRSQML